MADTLPNVTLTEDTWIDLYDATGLTPGDQIELQNIGKEPVYLYSGATAPVGIPGDAYNLLPVFEYAQNVSGDAGAWALSKGGKGLVNVRLAV